MVIPDYPERRQSMEYSNVFDYVDFDDVSELIVEPRAIAK